MGAAVTIYRFGPFEVNIASSELLKQGVRVKLQDQPFRLLVVLLENAGEMVSHEGFDATLKAATAFSCS